MFSNLSREEQIKSLLDRFNNLVKQCRIRYINRYELATEYEQTISDLCTCIEQILSHGLKKQTTFFNKARLLNGIIPPKNGITFWNYISLYLTEYELQRFLTLRNVHTDYGRGRSWIRNSLNEHSLEKNIAFVLKDKNNYKKQFYYEWSFMMNEQNSSLSNIAGNLDQILFALNIDNAELDVDVQSGDSKNSNDQLNKLIPTSNVARVKSYKKKTNIITINDDSNDSDIENDIYAKSAPVSSFHLPSSSHLTENINQLTINPQLITNNSTPSINEKMVLYPISDDKVNQSTENFNDVGKASFVAKELENVEFENERLSKENNLLKIQLKKYIAAIELIKYNKKEDNDSDKKNENIISYNYNDIKDYEKKLVQVSEMHGELVEFNEHLYRVIQQKDSIIARLRDELIELRGPLPESDDILSISSEVETNSNSIQIPQPLIHIWIPTAFLSGGFKGKSHHIYQIYIRLKEEEWNVYRRYSQFYTLHKSLKEKHSSIAELEFPPKKAIGNKDSRVVQERRKKLECYLRNMINYIQSQNNDIINKEKLVSIIPFLSDKYFMQDRSQSETNLSNTQQTNSQHYMGF